MKRKSSVNPYDRLKYRGPPATFYLDDITHIIQAIKDSGAHYSISDAEYDYDSLEEVEANRGDKRLRGLMISARFDGPYDSLTLEFDKGAVVLRADKSEKLIVLWHQIHDILKRRSPWYLRVICWRPMPFIAFAAMFVLPKPTELLAIFPNHTYVVMSIASLFAVLFLLSALSMLWQPTVYLKKKHEIQGFLGRNSEKLIVGLIGSLVGAVAKAIFDRLSL